MNGLLESKKSELRQKIVNVAGELFIQQGIAAATMDQIASRAMVTRETLDDCFAVKEAIADAYFSEICNTMTRDALESLPNPPDTKSCLMAVISSTFVWAETNPELARAILLYRLRILGSGGKFGDSASPDVIAEIIKRGREAGELRNDIPIKMVVAYINFLSSLILLDRLENNCREGIPGQLDLMVDLILNGIPNKPQQQASSNKIPCNSTD